MFQMMFCTAGLKSYTQVGFLMEGCAYTAVPLNEYRLMCIEYIKGTGQGIFKIENDSHMSF